jgi:hypothetical protein
MYCRPSSSVKVRVVMDIKCRGSWHRGHQTHHLPELPAIIAVLATTERRMLGYR